MTRLCVAPRRMQRMVCACAVALLVLPLPSHAGVTDAPECLVPAKPGGGFDLTCKLVGTMLEAESTTTPTSSTPTRKPLRIRYLPGGIGAVAFDRMVTRRLEAPDTLVAFSSGSLLNLAQGKFGPHRAADVRWVAALGTEYGAIAVRKDSPLQSLADLDRQLKRDKTRVVFGAGGTVGSQDWVKAALVVKAAGQDHKAMRFVSFEGGGEALTALAGKHVDVFCGDVAEALQAMEAGAPIRILAVLSEQRLPGALAAVPTAREQGVDLVWPTVRGVYVGSHVSDEDYRTWVALFETAMASPGFAQRRARAGLYAFSRTGPALDQFVRQQVVDYAALAGSLGLRVRGRD